MNEVVIESGGIKVSMPRDKAIEALLQTLVPQITIQSTIQKIGTQTEKGIYAGHLRGLNGADDYPVFAIPGPDDKNLNWHDGMKLGEGADVQMPDRREIALMRINLPELFTPDRWYWTRETHPSGSDYAFKQNFGGGGQGNGHKDGKYWVRLVRR